MEECLFPGDGIRRRHLDFDVTASLWWQLSHGFIFFFYRHALRRWTASSWMRCLVGFALHGCRSTMVIFLLRRDWQPLDHHLIPRIVLYFCELDFYPSSNMTWSFSPKKKRLS